MIVLVLGTPDSGKSRLAEDVVLELAGGDSVLYIATMIPYGEEGARRVEKHRRMRSGKGFLTVEKPTAVDRIEEALPCAGVEVHRAVEQSDGGIKDRPRAGGREAARLPEKCCLLECMSNLVGNEMHDPRGFALSDDALCALITGEVLALGKKFRHLVIVSNRFTGQDAGYDQETERFVRICNDINDILKQHADKTYELTEGEWKNGFTGKQRDHQADR